jgi:hypothetical protein
VNNDRRNLASASLYPFVTVILLTILLTVLTERDLTVFLFTRSTRRIYYIS